MFKISNKPNLYSFLSSNIEITDNKTIYKDVLSLLKKERIFNNTKKLDKFLSENLNFKANSSSFLFSLSSLIFEFSRRA